MYQTKRLRGLLACGTILVGLAAVAATSVSVAQFKSPPKDPNQLQVYLVRQAASDCTNSNVPNRDSRLVGGNCRKSAAGPDRAAAADAESGVPGDHPAGAQLDRDRRQGGGPDAGHGRHGGNQDRAAPGHRLPALAAARGHGASGAREVGRITGPGRFCRAAGKTPTRRAVRCGSDCLWRSAGIWHTRFRIVTIAGLPSFRSHELRSFGSATLSFFRHSGRQDGASALQSGRGRLRESVQRRSNRGGASLLFLRQSVLGVEPQRDMKGFLQQLLTALLVVLRQVGNANF
jgi:hypothetical protein